MVIDKWGEYQKPKYKEEEDGGFTLELDSRMAKCIEGYIVKQPCRICGVTDESSYGILSQTMTIASKQLRYHRICNQCFAILTDAVKFAKSKRHFKVIGKRRLQ